MPADAPLGIEYEGGDVVGPWKTRRFDEPGYAGKEGDRSPPGSVAGNPTPHAVVDDWLHQPKRAGDGGKLEVPKPRVVGLQSVGDGKPGVDARLLPLPEGNEDDPEVTGQVIGQVEGLPQEVLGGDGREGPGLWIQESRSLGLHAGRGRGKEQEQGHGNGKGRLHALEDPRGPLGFTGRRPDGAAVARGAILAPIAGKPAGLPGPEGPRPSNLRFECLRSQGRPLARPAGRRLRLPRIRKRPGS